MTNAIQPGKHVAVTAPRAVASGEGVLVGSLFGIATAAALISTEVVIETHGVFSHAKTSAQAWSAGDPIYWDDTNHVFDNVTGTLVGVAVEAAANPSATGKVRLNAGYYPPVADSLVRYAAVAVTNAEIKALRAAPKTLVAAPGAGKMLEFLSAELILDYGTNVLTETADNMAVRYTDGSGTLVSQAIEATGFIDATADTKTNALPKIDAIAAKTACENKALVLHNTGDGEYGGNAGNDTVMRVKVAYRVHVTGW